MAKAFLGVRASSDGTPPGFLNVRNYGAVGDGVTDDTEAFKTVRDLIYASRTIADGSLQPPLNGEPRFQLGYYIPPGDYLVTEPEAMYNAPDGEQNRRGFDVRGSGIANTNVIYKPTVPGPLIKSEGNLINGTHYDVMYVADSTDAVFWDSTAVNGSAGMCFNRCGWQGVWDRVFLLNNSGDNNSFFNWNDCRISMHVGTKAFLYSGALDADEDTNFPGDPKASDQQLWYQFNDCGFFVRCSICDFVNGGSINVHSCEILAWDPEDGKPFYLFDMGGGISQSHFGGSIGLRIRDMRAEHKHILCRLIRSTWYASNILLEGYDGRSMIVGANAAESLELITLNLYNKQGPIFAARDCNFPGWMKVNYNGDDLHPNCRIKVDTSSFVQEREDTFVRYDPYAPPHPQTNVTSDCRADFPSRYYAGLQLLLECNETDVSSNVLDSSPNGLPCVWGGSGTNDLATVPGPTVPANMLNGMKQPAANSYINCGNLLLPNADQTLALWFQTLTGNGSTISSDLIGTRDATNGGFAIGISAQKMFTARLGGSNYATTESALLNVGDGNWHHLAATWEVATSTLLLYYDGVLLSTYDLVADAATIDTAWNDALRTQVFGRVGSVVDAQAAVDDVRVYNWALTADNIDSLFTDPYPLRS